jgi:hypothetical protein
MERLANELGFQNRIHLWPDKSLGSKVVRQRVNALSVGVRRPSFIQWPGVRICRVQLLLNRLLTQVERLLEINALSSVTKGVVEAARETLVIGEV